MDNKISYNYNLEKKKINFVSYIITTYNKKNFVYDVIKSLCFEGGSHKREYIVIDDGSKDNSSFVYKTLSKKLPGKLTFVKRKNLGASYSTNEAVKKARGFWIRLLDGDDLVTYKSTCYMLYLAHLKNVSFVYGMIGEKKINQFDKNLDYKIQSKEEGLKKFIRNCPGNSSAILVSKERYIKSGGCNESFISPDQVLFLRLFSSGKAVFLNKVVAKLPEINSSSRLSGQVRRSRYESVLALINFCSENPKEKKQLLKQAYKRALSRANNYNKSLNKNFFSYQLLIYLYSKLYMPNNFRDLMRKSLKVFTKAEANRPVLWRTGSDKFSISSKYIKK